MIFSSVYETILDNLPARDLEVGARVTGRIRTSQLAHSFNSQNWLRPIERGREITGLPTQRTPDPRGVWEGIRHGGLGYLGLRRMHAFAWSHRSSPSSKSGIQHNRRVFLGTSVARNHRASRRLATIPRYYLVAPKHKPVFLK